jgi:hypothetical protein
MPYTAIVILCCVLWQVAKAALASIVSRFRTNTKSIILGLDLDFSDPEDLSFYNCLLLRAEDFKAAFPLARYTSSNSSASSTTSRFVGLCLRIQNYTESAGGTAAAAGRPTSPRMGSKYGSCQFFLALTTAVLLGPRGVARLLCWNVPAHGTTIHKRNTCIFGSAARSARLHRCPPRQTRATHRLIMTADKCKVLPS